MFNNHEIDTILSTLRLEADPSLHPLFEQFEKFYEEKLWFQLSESLTKFFDDAKSTPLRLRLYDNFVSKFYDKINQLSVVKYLLASLKDSKDFDESLKYLDDLKAQFQELDSKKQRNDGSKDHGDGILLIDSEIARTYLLKNDLVKARDLLDDLEKTLDKKDSIPLRITNSFYSTNSQYFKFKNDFNSFYYTSLLYLSTLEPSTSITLAERQQLAYDLSISALLGDKIYNFGELLHHPIMETIVNDSNYDWLFQLLNALTVGDFDKFDSLIKVQISKIPILAQHESFLRQKICLMTLIETVFVKNIRMLSFEDISKATHLPKDNVEHLVMRAISLGLLKGSIDQVNELVTISWVQPRIISGDQITKMKDRLVEWNDQVEKLGKKMEARGQSIWV
ncbi:Rpn9p [Saccharomyces cerevisiae YJM1419]|nr:Rpn9p [Saccharomyces cerevisiae YJM1418]AJV07941.1 Rpn9p [Saccharomyces cerevisiae YJM1419]CAI4369345.1 CCN_G0012630.mRNA.1.CDS.1 [Saccharomyces cerevisiae]CAI7223334.1 CCN_G0012630.mRNA.1.CDS.1 [Saccharomyces cerevisiae]